MKNYKNLLNKKVCILTSVHPVFDTRIFYKEAKTLVWAGYDVTLIAQHERNEIKEGVKIIALPKPKNRFFRIFGTTWKVFYLAKKQKADIYHFHDPELLPWMIRLKKKTNAKVIYDIHEDVPKQILSKYWIPKIFRKIVSFLFNWYEKRVSKKFDYIITAADEIEENFKKINKTTSIRNFPILENFKYQRKFSNKKCFKLIYVGGLAKIRGISEIVKAMEYLPDNVRLILVGNFSPESYKKEVEVLNGFKKVEYLGWVAPNRISFYLSQANIGLICLWPTPNYINSSTPTKLLEYMAAGLPAVASNFPLWRKIIEGNRCGICVDPLEPKEVAKTIEYLLEHPDEARKMGENGRKAVLEKYNWENESKKLLEAYEELCTK